MRKYYNPKEEQDMKIETIIFVIGVSIILVGIALAIIYQIPVRIS